MHSITDQMLGMITQGEAYTTGLSCHIQRTFPFWNYEFPIFEYTNQTCTSFLYNSFLSYPNRTQSLHNIQHTSTLWNGAFRIFGYPNLKPAQFIPKLSELRLVF